MNRYAYALETAKAPHQEPLVNIARGFVDALDQVIAEGTDPQADPAVVILGSFIAFHVHADVNTAAGYQKLLSDCEQRIINAPELQ